MGHSCWPKGGSLCLASDNNVVDTAILVENEYIEAVYINGKFKQTNKLNTNLVWSNEYTATGRTEGELPGRITIYSLTSAVGVKKTEYYKGMSLLFSVPINSEGTIFVDIDGLGQIHLTDGSNNKIFNEIYKNDLVMAVYDGAQFVKHNFSSIEVAPVILEEEDFIPQEIPDDIWAFDYTGDKDDPANADNPTSVDSQNNPIFDPNIITVGPSGGYTSLDAAITELVNQFGETGSGRKIAIKLLSNYVPPSKPPSYTTYIYLKGRTDTADLRWISIFSEGLSFINFNSAMLYCKCAYTPIFNFKMAVSKSYNTQNVNWTAFYLDGGNTQITFGKNMDIKYNVPGSHNVINSLGTKNSLEALYGFELSTNAPFFRGSHVINHATLTFNASQNYGPLLSTWNDHLMDQVTRICNTTIFCPNPSKYQYVSALYYLHKNNAVLTRVISTDRTFNTKGVEASGSTKLLMTDCNFSSSTSGSSTNGVDIVVSVGAEIRLTNSTGNTNQATGIRTKNGEIIVT